MSTLRILGIDPGLVATGWGAIERTGNSLAFIACGTIRVSRTQPLAQRLSLLLHSLQEVVACHEPDHLAIEEVFLGKNPKTTLTLGQARAVALLAVGERPYAEYAPRTIKQVVSASGSADKQQIRDMLRRLLPDSPLAGVKNLDEQTLDEHASDALAVALCHAFSLKSKDLEQRLRETA